VEYDTISQPHFFLVESSKFRNIDINLSFVNTPKSSNSTQLNKIIIWRSYTFEVNLIYFSIFQLLQYS